MVKWKSKTYGLCVLWPPWSKFGKHFNETPSPEWAGSLSSHLLLDWDLAISPSCPLLHWNLGSAWGLQVFQWSDNIYLEQPYIFNFPRSSEYTKCWLRIWTEGKEVPVVGQSVQQSLPCECFGRLRKLLSVSRLPLVLSSWIHLWGPTRSTVSSLQPHVCMFAKILF